MMTVRLITSCVVVPVEGASFVSSRRRRPSMTKAAQTALRALGEAIEENGERPGCTDHVPPHVSVTTVEEWRTLRLPHGSLDF